MIDDVLDDITAARVSIDEAREALPRALKLGGGDEIRRELGRLNRLAGGLERVEGVVAGRTVVA